MVNTKWEYDLVLWRELSEWKPRSHRNHGLYRRREISIWKYTHGIQYGRMNMEKQNESSALKISSKLQVTTIQKWISPLPWKYESPY